MKKYLFIGAAILGINLAFGQQPPPPPNPPTPVGPIAAGLGVTGCPTSAVLFNTPTNTLGCNNLKWDDVAQNLQNTGANNFLITSGAELRLGTGPGGTARLSADITFFNTSVGSAIAGIKTSGVATGVLQLIDNTGSNFNRIALGGATASFPSLKKSANTVLSSRLADDSSDGEFQARSYIYGGPVPTVGGTCGSFGTPVGGNTNGTISSTAICGIGSTITLTFAFTAPTGWNCAIDDRTTGGAAVRQTGTTQTVATFTVTAATVANDIIQYGPCGAY